MSSAAPVQVPESLSRYSSWVRTFTEELLQGRELPLYDMVRYHLGWVDANGRPEARQGGKGLRSTLCLLCVEALHGSAKQAIPAAAALELVHNFSLVHDDIEDRSPQRRSRDTVWRLWGDAQAINAGDSLFTLARLAVLRLAGNDVAASKVLQVALMLDEACLHLCEGQFMDLDFQSRIEVSEEEYLAMIGGKTAALMSAACGIGAFLGGADPRTLTLFAEAGRHLGLAFQIRDDDLGLWGEEAVLGKPVGEDLRERKRTLPVIYGLRLARGSARGELEVIFRDDKPSDAEVSRGLAILEAAGAREYAQRTAQAFSREALANLRETGLSNAAFDELEQLIHFSVERSF